MSENYDVDDDLDALDELEDIDIDDIQVDELEEELSDDYDEE